MKTLDNDYWQCFCADEMPMNLKKLRKIRRKYPPLSKRGEKRFVREMEKEGIDLNFQI